MRRGEVKQQTGGGALHLGMIPRPGAVSVIYIYVFLDGYSHISSHTVIDGRHMYSLSR